MKTVSIDSYDKVAIIDDEDFDTVSQYTWQLHIGRSGILYARTNVVIAEKRTTIYLHTLVIGCKRGHEIDHINHNGLDCRKQNMRFATHSQNLANARIQANNSSGYRGVSWETRSGKWKATIAIENRRIHLGYFTSKEDAAKAYDKAASKAFGEFAYRNIL